MRTLNPGLALERGAGNCPSELVGAVRALAVTVLETGQPGPGLNPQGLCVVYVKKYQ